MRFHIHAVSEDEIINKLDVKQMSCSIFLDLKEAFDTVSHKILLSKLEKYGIRGLSLQLLQSYLCYRYQYTVVNNCKSRQIPVTYGVPQGSNLSPLLSLFIIYVDDLPLASNLNTKLFADDTVLTLSNKRLKSPHTAVNNELARIEYWLKINKLSLNYNKTKYSLCYF